MPFTSDAAWKVWLLVAFCAMCSGSVWPQTPVDLINADNFQNRIVGGQASDISHFPYLVSVQEKGEHLCGGSIISSRWILTAAHCFHSGMIPIVRAGSSTHNRQGTVHTVRRIIIHENYNLSDVDWDVAVMELNTMIPNAQPIQLVEQGDPLIDGAVAVVSGWGVTLNSDSNEQLRATSVKVLNQNTCIKAYYLFGLRVTNRMLCAAQLGRDACNGDSGGPLVADGKQIGIVSWGVGCAIKGFPGVYTRVARIRPWIRDKTGV